MTEYWCELAWLGGPEPAAGVLIECDDDGWISGVAAGNPATAGATELEGLTVPALANAHSHAFQRALRGRAQTADGGSFWTWRAQMYALATELDEERVYRLARATFGEMALAGIGLVGEFDYVHHSAALIQAATEVGIRLTLIDACYLDGGLERFHDADVDAWAARVAAIDPGPDARMAAAIHSVRAVDPESAAAVAAFARERRWPLHAHVSEQPLENEQCMRRHGFTPAGVLVRAGAVDERFTAVHATHLTDEDAELLRGAYWCMCPTTERDLADGIGRPPAGRITLGSDSHAVIDLFEEARAVELDARLATQIRGTYRAIDLAVAATANGYASLGWPEGGRIAPGAPCDLTTVRLDSVRLAGTAPRDALDAVIFAATAGDVSTLCVGGRVVVNGGAHVTLDVPAELTAAIAAVS